MEKYWQKLSMGGVRAYLKLFERRPFLTSFIILLIAYIPYIIISYPATFMGDTISMISQYYPQTGYSMASIEPRLLSKDVMINNHHPVAYSALLHFFISFGMKFLGSANRAIFMFALFQFLLVISVIAFSIRLMVKKLDVSAKVAHVVILYYLLLPLIRSYMFLLTKDVMYGAFFILLLISLFRILNNDAGKKYFVIFSISMLGMVLFRNDGRYVLLFALVLIFIINKNYRKLAACSIILVLIFTILYSNVLLPSLDITPGSTREMLSVPFQQTARYIKYHGEEVTSEEKDAINAILNYDVLAKKYDPNISDPVKGTFNELSTKKDLVNYFKVWAKMFFKHPGTYIQATMNNYYRYFYPEISMDYGIYKVSEPRRDRHIYSYLNSTRYMNSTNRYTNLVGISFSYPEELSKYRHITDEVVWYIKYFSPIFIFMMAPTYIWCILLMVSYATRQKNITMLSILCLFLALMLILFTAPVNAYHRYPYPMILSFPLLLSIFLKQTCIQREQGGLE